ncbi:four-carbon acid sugar kinase family protein [Streptomyces sp. NPDC088400]|uniref:four-carbon acid sugar kinase family protein n=1 Tax=Streptomyces sp. NPDC088400 TaxID=3365861 RepID=UPI00381A223F
MLHTLRFPEAAELPPVREADPAEVRAAIAGGRRLVVLDDDPTGTQTVAGVPVLTTWTVDDLRWALRQDSTAFFVLTNTRSLAPEAAAARNREVVRALTEASAAEGTGFVLASRGDSTLRGHFPLETDVLAEEVPVDGVVLVPAYIEAGRLTAGSVHWMRTADGMLPVAESEFAKDATFGYANSGLPEWIEEKTGGRIPAGDVLRITLEDIRLRGAEHVAGLLTSLSDGRPAVVDALCDDDLRVLALASATAEGSGARLLYRVGPSFVRARAGQAAHPPLTAAELRTFSHPGASPTATSQAEASRTSQAEASRPAAHGLIAVGSHVGLTTRQLDRLRERGGLAEFELDVPSLLDEDRRAAHVAEVAQACAEALGSGEVVLRTTRALVTGADADDSLAIARAVSGAVVETVRAITAERRPAFVVAKGGITSSDVATQGLEIRRAWARGTLLPGIVSLWEPVSGPSVGIPYIVFAGNVGGEDALADVVDLLRSR